VKSDSEPVLREDSTSRSSPAPFLITAATTGPAALALIESATCCSVSSASTAIVIVFGSPAL
jgi:hypothetical protein